jgi:hypothetical protein
MFYIIRYSYSLFPTYWLNVLLYPFSNGGGRSINLAFVALSAFCLSLMQAVIEKGNAMRLDACMTTIQPVVSVGALPAALTPHT